MKSEREKQVPYANTYIYIDSKKNQKQKQKHGTDEPSGRAGIKM